MSARQNRTVFIIVTGLALFIGFFLGQYSAMWSNSKVIRAKSIIEAQKIIGIDFTKSERDTMIEGLRDQVKNYQGIRGVKLSNNIQPSVIFNPIPSGFEFKSNQKKIEYSDYSATVLPDNMDDLAYYSIGQLAYLIKNYKITSVELTTYFLNRLKKYGSKLECVISLTEDRALQMARKADAELAKGKYRGLLHGIPYGAKDLIAVKGYKTTWGAEPYKQQIINDDATVIRKLDQAGAVLCAKLTLGALAWGDVWYGGKTRNPWNIEQGSSGSSAGSASSVSAGLLPFALGTETWGSIISPSTVCGVTGLRPTFGTVSRKGAMALSWTMDKPGPICRNTEDLAIVFSAIRGADGFDNPMYDPAFNYSPNSDLSKLKVGFLKDDFASDYSFHYNDSLSLQVIQNMGIELIPVQLTELPVNDLSIILSAEAGAAFSDLTLSAKDDMLVRQIQNAWPNVFRQSRLIPAVEYINANRIRTKIIEEMKLLMEQVDIYIAPSWHGDNLLLTNLTGHPCVVLPNGFSEEGTPTSISFTGKLFGEDELIAFAKKYQDATNHHLKHPVIE